MSTTSTGATPVRPVLPPMARRELPNGYSPVTVAKHDGSRRQEGASLKLDIFGRIAALEKGQAAQAAQIDGLQKQNDQQQTAIANLQNAEIQSILHMVELNEQLSNVALCPICQTAKPNRVGECGHTMCLNCVNDWERKTGNACPLC